MQIHVFSLPICILNSPLETNPFPACDVILCCTICVTLFITFYASLIHILIVSLFLRTGDRSEQRHKNKIIKLIMLAVA